ncbi:conserved hypothetical protein [Histoplasma capsulatum G186AR]|uniref:Uncharacterized protein n=1 Tax=Ajellomyces capsulatus (strain G186AR / H82 / ATCC MYA-2454 / RMSCC 2432) TaxID=447093 RepID=C0NA77_AJECG|nr:uncharacterized protein HCBG_00023 [Histoplasma capsulatum G186AR]EEH10568.1 conserved hypothetical protein [Histoplasma capsulatum G186AR]
MDWLYPFSGIGRRARSRDRYSTTSSSRHSHSHSHSHGHSHGHGHGKSHSRSSLFNLGGHANRSTTSAASLFSIGSAGSSSSRRAKPRSGFVARVVRSIRRLFRHIVRYARSHPLKVFFMVIMPLITGGVLQKLLSVVGIRLPPSLGGGHSGGFKTGNGGGAGGGGLGESVGGLVSLAKMFV